jgi:hypothetical protein
MIGGFVSPRFTGEQACEDKALKVGQRQHDDDQEAKGGVDFQHGDF